MDTPPDHVDPDEVLTLDEAARELSVPPDQVRTMVEDGLLVPADPDPAAAPRFTRAAVEAVRLAGG